MNKKWTNMLYMRYPSILRAKNNSVPESGVRFECFDGWYDLLWELCETLEWQALMEGQPVPEAVQIKQKFGALRFYTDGATKQMLELIRDAESRSVTICEICGEPGERLSNGVCVKTRCEKHRDE